MVDPPNANETLHATAAATPPNEPNNNFPPPSPPLNNDKDEDKHAEERRDVVKSNLRPYDEQVRANHTDAANDCAQVFSHIITDRFSETNLDAQNCANKRIEFCTEEQLSRNVASSWKVYQRSIGKDKSRIVEEIDGKLFCSCHKDINSGELCRHIQCVLCGSF